MTEVKIGDNGHSKTVQIEEVGLFPNPATIKKAVLAKITFDHLLDLKNEVERLKERVDKLEKEQ